MEYSLTALAGSKLRELGFEQKQDNRWNSESKNVLKQVKSYVELQEMHQEFIELKHVILERCQARQRTILCSQHWEDHVIEAWCYNGFITRISSDTLNYYDGFLSYLGLQAMELSWEEAKREIDHMMKRCP